MKVKSPIDKMEMAVSSVSSGFFKLYTELKTQNIHKVWREYGLKRAIKSIDFSKLEETINLIKKEKDVGWNKQRYQDALDILLYILVGHNKDTDGYVKKNVDEVIDYLVDKGSGVNSKCTRNRAGTSLLLLAIQNNNDDAVHTLLSHGAEFSKSYDNPEAAMIAIVRANLQIKIFLLEYIHGPVGLFIRQHINIHFRYQQGYTPLHAQILADFDLEQIKALEKMGADITQRDKEQLTPYDLLECECANVTPTPKYTKALQYLRKESYGILYPGVKFIHREDELLDDCDADGFSKWTEDFVAGKIMKE